MTKWLLLLLLEVLTRNLILQVGDGIGEGKRRNGGGGVVWRGDAAERQDAHVVGVDEQVCGTDTLPREPRTARLVDRLGERDLDVRAVDARAVHAPHGGERVLALLEVHEGKVLELLDPLHGARLQPLELGLCHKWKINFYFKVYLNTSYKLCSLKRNELKISFFFPIK